MSDKSQSNLTALSATDTGTEFYTVHNGNSRRVAFGNVSFLQSGTGAASRGLMAKVREFFFVTDFGATGDGTTDDTAEIAAALLAASTARGRVFFPKGTYLISSTLTGYSDIEMVGESNGASVIKAATGWTNGNALVSVSGKSRTVARDLGFASVSTKASSAYINIITASADCLVENCRFDANFGWNVFIGTASIGNTVNRCIGEGSQTHNVEINGSSFNSVTNCVLKSATGSGVEIYHNGVATSTRGNRVVGNYISGSGSSGIALFGTIQSVIDGNTITGTTNAGIYLTPSEITASVIPTGDVISNNSIQGPSAQDGMSVGESAYLTISGNSVRSAGLSGMGLYCEYSTIIGNTVTNCGQHGILINISGAIGGHNTVIGNICADNSTSVANSFDGIDVTSDYNTIVGNRCFNNRYGILLQSGAENNTLAANELEGNDTDRYADNSGVTTNTIIDSAAVVLRGALTPYAGVVAAGGFTARPQNIHTGDLPPATSAAGTNLTPIITETYIAAVFVPCNMTITGVRLFNGDAVSGNIKIGLFDSAGVNVAATASTAQSGTDAYQQVAFTSAYAAVGPATYYVGVQIDNTTGRLNVHPFGAFGASKKTGETYGTFTTITAPTTFTADVGPMATLY